MRSLLLGLAVSLAMIGTAAADTAGKVVGAMMYADWCASCKVLDPKVQALEERLEKIGVTLVKLDYTARNKDALLAQADAAGVQDAVAAWAEKKVKTGQFLLIDSGTNRVIGVVTKSYDQGQILAAAQSAVSAVKGL